MEPGPQSLTLVAMARAGAGRGGGTAWRVPRLTARSRIRRPCWSATFADLIDCPGIDAKLADLMPASAILTVTSSHHAGAPQRWWHSLGALEVLLLERAGICQPTRVDLMRANHRVGALPRRKFRATTINAGRRVNLLCHIFRTRLRKHSAAAVPNGRVSSWSLGAAARQSGTPSLIDRHTSPFVFPYAHQREE